MEKDGKVTSYLVNTFDKDFYNLDGLTQMVEEEAEEFNATHTEATENPMNVKTVQVLGDGAMVQVVQEFADTDSAGTGTHGESGICKRSGRHSGGF